MTYTIIIILIAFLIVCGIAATAVQQHNERKETEKREEVSRQKQIFEETEEAILAASQMPISQVTIAILRKRALNALKTMYEYNPTPDVISRIDEGKKVLKNMDLKSPAPNQNSFTLPDSDKIIIKYIQAVKRIRNLLRSENAKGNVPPKLFAQEDKAVESLQLRVNVETLHKRAADAIKTQLQGSARQYLEKAISALKKHKPPSDYTQKRLKELEELKGSLENSVKDSNMQNLIDAKHADSEEIDELFAPKKKW